MDLEFVRQSQQQVKELLATLAGYLPPHKSEPGRPALPADAKLTKVEAKAAYNYWMVFKDGTYGVHNPVYIRQLLEGSIEALKNE